jgi:hypothetical protein
MWWTLRGSERGAFVPRKRVSAFRRSYLWSNQTTENVICHTFSTLRTHHLMNVICLDHRMKSCVDEDLSVMVQLRMRCARGFYHDWKLFEGTKRRLVNRSTICVEVLGNYVCIFHRLLYFMTVSCVRMSCMVYTCGVFEAMSLFNICLTVNH